jgi:hypothetical protein
MRMLMLRRTKMSRLRRMMLRRKTDPKTGKHTLCEPAQAKHLSSFHKSHLIRKCRKNAAPQIEPGTQTHILCEPAQSKCMSTCHKRH